MESKQIVWICGGAAAGKETFMRRVIAGKEPDVCKRFEWIGELPVSSQISLSLVGRYPGDIETTEKRSGIVKEVSQILAKAQTVLIKEQRVDLRTGRPQELQELFPESRHILIILECTDVDERMNRYSTKPFAKHDATYEELVENFNISLKMMSKLVNFEIYALDSSSDRAYQDMSLPAQLKTL